MNKQDLHELDVLKIQSEDSLERRMRLAQNKRSGIT
jgi:hypothetical protein